MRNIFIIFLFLILCISEVKAQQSIAPCVTTGVGVCPVVTATNPLPMTVIGTSGATSGYVYTSNGPGVAATFQPSSGSSGSPGGSSPQLQYNNAGSFGGIANSGATSSGQVGIGTATPNTGVALDLGSNTTSANSSLLLPIGSSAARPATGINGMVRYNSTLATEEGYVNGLWTSFLNGGAVNTYTGAHTVVSTEVNGLDVLNSASNFSFTLPQAGTAGFEAGKTYNFLNINTGILTLTTSTSVFNGMALTSSNIVLNQYGFATCVSDGTNWNCAGQPAGSSSGTVNSSTQYYLGYYAANGTAISGLSTIKTDSNNDLIVASGGVTIGTTSLHSGVSLDIGSETNSLLLPIGTTGQRPGTGVNGMLRYNSTTPAIEGYINNTWTNIGTSSVSVTSGSASVVINPTPGTGTFTVATTDTTNAQTGTTYTILSTDMTKTVTSNNSSSIATTLPVATTTGFGAGAAFSLINIGTSVNTMTPTTSTVNLYTKETLPNGWGSYNISDGTNYAVFYSNPSPYNVGVPTVTSCGSGTLVTGSTNNKGQISGISAATACTITFSSPMPAAPACSFSSNNAITPTGVPTTSGVTIAMTALTGTMTYLCY